MTAWPLVGGWCISSCSKDGRRVGGQEGMCLYWGM